MRDGSGGVRARQSESEPGVPPFDGALDARAKQLIAVAVAHTTQCPYCIKGHTRLAIREGATAQEIMESIWVAAEMRAGGAYAHATIALNELCTERSMTHGTGEQL